jgi:hypothetical protein
VYRRLFFAFLYILAGVLLDILQRRSGEEAFMLRWPRLAQSFLYAALIFLIILISMGSSAAQPFVYQGF